MASKHQLTHTSQIYQTNKKSFVPGTRKKDQRTIFYCQEFQQENAFERHESLKKKNNWRVEIWCVYHQSPLDDRGNEAERQEKKESGK